MVFNETKYNRELRSKWNTNYIDKKGQHVLKKTRRVRKYKGLKSHGDGGSPMSDMTILCRTASVIIPRVVPSLRWSCAVADRKMSAKASAQVRSSGELRHVQKMKSTRIRERIWETKPNLLLKILTFHFLKYHNKWPVPTLQIIRSPFLALFLSQSIIFILLVRTSCSRYLSPL